MSDMAKLLHLMETLTNEDKVEKIIEKCNFSYILLQELDGIKLRILVNLKRNTTLQLLKLIKEINIALHI